MDVNEGRIDRLLRITLGFVLILMLPVTPWGWVGLIPLVTGLAGSCPLYAALGIRTCGKRG